VKRADRRHQVREILPLRIPSGLFVQATLGCTRRSLMPPFSPLLSRNSQHRSNSPPPRRCCRAIPLRSPASPTTRGRFAPATDAPSPKDAAFLLPIPRLECSPRPAQRRWCAGSRPRIDNRLRDAARSRRRQQRRLNDFAVLEKRLERLEKDRKKIKNSELDREYDLLVKCKEMIEANQPLRELK